MYSQKAYIQGSRKIELFNVLDSERKEKERPLEISYQCFWLVILKFFRVIDGENLKNVTTVPWNNVTCNEACWRVSFFDNDKGNVRNDYGCRDETNCDAAYQSEQCYRADASGRGHVCVQCCLEPKCNSDVITEERKRELLGSDSTNTSTPLKSWELLTIILVATVLHHFL